MKRHGNYQLLTPDELLLNAQSPASEAFVNNYFNKLRKKHSNDQRHQHKRRKNQIS